MRQALGLPTLLILAMVAPAAMADSYYIGVTGGYSQLRDAQFEIGPDNETRVSGDYGGGDTVSLTLGHASEGGASFNGRAEFEFGFQRDTVDSMRFDDTIDDEGSRERIFDVSGTTDVSYGFYNAMGDFSLTSNTSFTTGFGFGLGRVTFDGHSARTKGLVMDDDDFTYGYQLSAGISYRLLSALDLELAYRFRSFQDVSLVAEGGAKSKLSLSSHNALAGFRVRF